MGQRSAAELIIFTISGIVNAARPMIVPYKTIYSLVTQWQGFDLINPATGYL
jgi:hypothetical protein